MKSHVSKAYFDFLIAGYSARWRDNLYLFAGDADAEFLEESKSLPVFSETMKIVGKDKVKIADVNYAYTRNTYESKFDKKAKVVAKDGPFKNPWYISENPDGFDEYEYKFNGLKTDRLSSPNINFTQRGTSVECTIDRSAVGIAPQYLAICIVIDNVVTPFIVYDLGKSIVLQSKFLLEWNLAGLMEVIDR